MALSRIPRKRRAAALAGVAALVAAALLPATSALAAAGTGPGSGHGTGPGREHGCASSPEPVTGVARHILDIAEANNPSWTTAHGAILTQNICDLATSARAIGSGQLLSSPAWRQFQLNPGTVGLGDPNKCPPGICRLNTEAAHYGFGVQVINTWVVQNPSFSGYFAVQAYLPSRDLSIAVSTTDGPSTVPNTNYAQTIAHDIAAYLAPEHPLS